MSTSVSETKETRWHKNISSDTRKISKFNSSYCNNLYYGCSQLTFLYTYLGKKLQYSFCSFHKSAVFTFLLHFAKSCRCNSLTLSDRTGSDVSLFRSTKRWPLLRLLHQSAKVIKSHDQWWIQRPPSKRDLILSFSHSFSPKSVHVGG